ncbi:MAG: hypothetical protein IKK26_02960 [Clostridia bacterium]|nr:hypothetical protein [Clostridia bacterium]
MIYLKEQCARHPSMEARDVLKLCFQAAFGAEHILSDVNKAKDYFFREFEYVSPTDEPVFERISDEVCRVNLGAWKKEGIPAKWLFNMFLLSGKISADNSKAFAEYIAESEKEFDGFSAFFDEYIRGGIRPVHHSDCYRANEQPHYRVVKSEIVRIIPILRKISSANAKVVLIDGRAASGKSTVSSLLEKVIDCEIIHMDHFFLPVSLRSKERLSEIGGNVHYERFAEEVLPNLRSEKEFSYRIFDCSKMDYGEDRTIKNKSCVVVEGSYSAHPFFGNYADLKVFSDVEETEQIRRITLRNGEKMAKRFESEWIPMEEKYFAHFNIKETADVII